MLMLTTPYIPFRDGCDQNAALPKDSPSLVLAEVLAPPVPQMTSLLTNILQSCTVLFNFELRLSGSESFVEQLGGIRNRCENRVAALPRASRAAGDWLHAFCRGFTSVGRLGTRGASAMVESAPTTSMGVSH